MPVCTDETVLNLWFAICATQEMQPGIVQDTVLLEEDLSFALDADGSPRVWRRKGELRAGAELDIAKVDELLPAQCAYGYVWTCLGTPSADIFPIEEYDEPDRRNLNAASIGVNVSGPRAIENFLDMGHFPYVHTDILGQEPHTEVKEYEVEISEERDEILATECRFFQPMASTASSGGADVEYVYRVPHPYCSVLYKSSGQDPSRMDVIALFIQPINEERIRAHMLLSIIDDDSEERVMRRFQQTIFGQDKPILENQYPKKLPLDPRAETPIRADKSAIAYRRWLRAKGVTYGVIPSAG
ncbi:aromatic ring-hydroxylating dioxygenase subunit alpha [Hoeflea sp. TYP-13]|uniref:aromatic ring-hydroxylating dioxygenase subunit alpha n=1 Tax=Hoeflea sp. TYP-13 TaxID=3230023 RepID=UPI0034C68545